MLEELNGKDMCNKQLLEDMNEVKKNLKKSELLEKKARKQFFAKVRPNCKSKNEHGDCKDKNRITAKQIRRHFFSPSCHIDNCPYIHNFKKK